MTIAELRRVLDTVFRLGKGRLLTEDEDLALLVYHVEEQLAPTCSDAGRADR